MLTSIDIKSLTKKEKIILMEQLWENLNESIETPEWHLRVLKETEERIASGKEQVIDWSTAKDMLKKKF